MPKNCYIIKRQVTHTMLTNVDRNVLAFAKKEHAQSYLKVCTQLRDDRQKLQVDPTSLERLRNRCSMNALKICYMDTEMNMETLEPTKVSSDDMSFYLDNNIWFYDP